MSKPPLNPNFKADVAESFKAQQAMALIRATLPVIEHGRVEVHMPWWEGVTQQNHFVHGGVVGMVADSTAGYAAMTVAPADAAVLSVEYKINFTAPAVGQKIIGRGQVIKPGRRLIVSRADIFAVDDSNEKLCATMQQTIMVLPEGV